MGDGRHWLSFVAGLKIKPVARDEKGENDE
jgi:hypothetical protein